MRTNLKVGFAEKDKVKALGARWDPALKVWYVENVPDLARFAPWIPGLTDSPLPHMAEKKSSAASKAPTSTPPRSSAKAMVSGPAGALPDCGCDALPWEHCEHTVPR